MINNKNNRFSMSKQPKISKKPISLNQENWKWLERIIGFLEATKGIPQTWDDAVDWLKMKINPKKEFLNELNKQIE